MVTNQYKCAKLKFQRYYFNQIYSIKYMSAKDLLKKKIGDEDVWKKKKVGGFAQLYTLQPVQGTPPIKGFPVCWQSAVSVACTGHTTDKGVLSPLSLWPAQSTPPIKGFSVSRLCGLHQTVAGWSPVAQVWTPCSCSTRHCSVLFFSSSSISFCFLSSKLHQNEIAVSAENKITYLEHCISSESFSPKWRRFVILPVRTALLCA